MLTAIVLISYALVILFDLVPSWKTWNTKEKIVYLVALAAGLCVLFLQSIHIKVPGPSPFIIDIVTRIFPWAG